MKDQKDQQRTTSIQQNRQNQREQEQRWARQGQNLHLPAQQWLQFLQNTNGELLELPAPLLEQLAKGVGNSSLIQLLRQGGGEGPALCGPGDLSWAGEELEENPIQTAPPALYPLEGGFSQGAWLPPTRPDALRTEG